MYWHRSPTRWNLEVPEAQLREERMVAKRYQREKNRWKREQRLKAIRTGVAEFGKLIDHAVGQSRVRAGRWRRKLTGELKD